MRNNLRARFWFDLRSSAILRSVDCHDTSVQNCQSTLRNIPEARTSLLHRARKPAISQSFYFSVSVSIEQTCDAEPPTSAPSYFIHLEARCILWAIWRPSPSSAEAARCGLRWLLESTATALLTAGELTGSSTVDWNRMWLGSAGPSVSISLLVSIRVEWIGDVP